MGILGVELNSVNAQLERGLKFVPPSWREGEARNSFRRVGGEKLELTAYLHNNTATRDRVARFRLDERIRIEFKFDSESLQPFLLRFLGRQDLSVLHLYQFASLFGNFSASLET